MPEGHTIHRIARDHSKLLTGRPVHVWSPQGPFAPDAARVDGATLERIEPYGKHLFYHWSTGEIGHVHLGLFGKFKVFTDDDRPQPQGAIRMRLESDSATIDLSGPTACTIDDPSVRTGILARLGPDPIMRRANPQQMYDKISKSRRGIGDLLMDQSVVAGIGNVYRAEVLFACGIHPLRPGTDLDPAELELLWTTITRMLRRGVKDNRIVTMTRADSDVPRNRPIPRADATYAYKRDHCVRCGTEIQHLDIANRTSYHCPTCQPR
ncbi:Fpg/Nei family DNA glycosylase [Ilumatobacter nonamiensis]|uniref:Fpg/Nei family DNA glycosylase n=1 Tax=Ilumatobacter nonamiensis TaxID=467093 RepID=UPI000349C8A6|nr:DNA-formamidopyrimidine glycosylase family protein [Ilumatobacter nonamiensis]